MVPNPNLYEKFKCMKVPDFEGSSDPLVTDGWLAQIQVILDFINIVERDKVKCASFVMNKDARYLWETVVLRRDVSRMTWADFVKEFNSKFFNRRGFQKKEFNELRQRNMTVTEAVTKFN